MSQQGSDEEQQRRQQQEQAAAVEMAAMGNASPQPAQATTPEPDAENKDEEKQQQTADNKGPSPGNDSQDKPANDIYDALQGAFDKDAEKAFDKVMDQLNNQPQQPSPQNSQTKEDNLDKDLGDTDNEEDQQIQATGLGDDGGLESPSQDSAASGLDGPDPSQTLGS